MSEHIENENKANNIEKETQRQKALLIITKQLFGFTVAALLLLGIAFYGLNWLLEKRTCIVLIVFAAGLIGGFLSIQQRLPKARLEELQELAQSWPSILLIPVTGGIFAVLLHILFISNLLAGKFFPIYMIPNFVVDNPFSNFQNFLVLTFPASGEDTAKLFFWAFVAGFSERLVPQIITGSTSNFEGAVGKRQGEKEQP